MDQAKGTRDEADTGRDGAADKHRGQDGAPAGGPLAKNPERADADAEAGDDEVGGPAGPEPTRFGDWERKGRCIDF